MYNLLLETKCRASRDGEVWLISANCPELARAIPLLMRDPKNLDDVLKTDKGTAKIEQDVADAVRYGLKSMLSSAKVPKQAQLQEKLLEVQQRFAAEHGISPAAVSGADWASKFGGRVL